MKHSIDQRQFARETWQAFQIGVKRNEELEKKKKKASLSRQLLLKSGPMYTQGPPGPLGPRGPRGLRGPKGGNFTKEEVIEIIRQVLKQRATYSQATQNTETSPKCTEHCSHTHTSNKKTEGNSTEAPILPRLYDSDQTVFVHQMSTAFVWELSDDILVAQNSFIELTKFHRTYATGGYQRNVEDFASEIGRFTAPRSGFYTFYVRLHIDLRTSDGETRVNLSNELFSALLCIDSSCKDNMNLETISGFPVGKRTTVAINGMFYLTENEYVSIFLDNSSRYSIKIFQGSQFSGYLTGV